MLQDPLVFYSQPGMMTDPGKYASLLAGLPDDLASICLAVQNNLVHVFWAERMGLTLTEDQQASLQIRPVAEKLALLAKVSDQPLNVSRPLNQRQVGNCRDFSVLLCSILHHKGMPARAGCGFGTYFEPGHYEDHWICEYWNAGTRRWAMVDSQLDSFQRGALDIKFDPLDVPPEEFIIIGRAWEMCRSGRADPEKFGIFDMHGIRFIWGDVVRDFLALNKIEIRARSSFSVQELNISARDSSRNGRCGGAMKHAYGVFATLAILLLIGLVAYANLRPAPTSTSSSTETTQNSTSYPGETIFSSQEMKSACPDLPTANQLLSEARITKVMIIPRNANVGPVMNYSSTVLGYMNGQMYPNWVNIYMTNGTVWVEVPESIL